MVSFILPDYIDENDINRCICLIKRQNILDIEIIIALSDSECANVSSDVIVVHKGTNEYETIKNVIDVSNGDYLYFISSCAISSSNCIEELVKSNNCKEKLYIAHDVICGQYYFISYYAFHRLNGKLFLRECFKQILSEIKNPYCISEFIWSEYRKLFTTVEFCDKAFVYYTDDFFIRNKNIEVVYEKEQFCNCLKQLILLDDDSRRIVENYLINTVHIDRSEKEEVCSLVSDYGDKSFKLMISFVIPIYQRKYMNACKTLNSSEYERVKNFLISIENEDEILSIALKKLSISPEMFSAMKRLDFNNYVAAVEDNTLFVAMQYPNGIKNIYGTELDEYVVSRYKNGCLGLKTIIKSFYAWLIYKISGMKG